jgi:hypothetical protein
MLERCESGSRSRWSQPAAIAYAGEVRAVVAIAFIVSGCDQLIGIDQLHASTGDAGDAGDAGLSSIPCKDRKPKPIFCGDFDESTTPTFYVDGIGTTTGFPIDGTVTVGPPQAPFTTGTNGITFASTGSGTSAKYTGAAPVLSLDATFAMRIVHTSAVNQSTGVFLLSIPTAPDCYAALNVEENAQQLSLSGFCLDSTHAPSTFVGPIPATWVEVELTFSVATGIATITIDHGPVQTIIYGIVSLAKRPVLEFGIHAPNHPGLSVEFDDITVTGSDVK